MVKRGIIGIDIVNNTNIPLTNTSDHFPGFSSEDLEQWFILKSFNNQKSKFIQTLKFY